MPFGISTRSALRSESVRARRAEPTPSKSLEDVIREFRKPLPFRIAGPAIGIGAQKEVFPAVGRENVVLRVLRAESGFPPLAGVGTWEPRRLMPFAEEHANLGLVRRWGLPASRILATGQSLGRPADAVRRRTIGSKELFSLRDEDPRLYEELLERLFSGEAGPRALRLLARFESAFARGLVIPDFQVMFDRGLVEYSDAGRRPYDTKVESPPGLPEDLAKQRKSLGKMQRMVQEGIDRSRRPR